MSATTNMLESIHLTKVLCSQCSSMAHFQCMDHCKEVFCGKCSVKHRAVVTNKMNELAQQLKNCKIDSLTTHDEIDENFARASKQTIQHTHDTANNLIEEIRQREQSLIEQINYSLQLRQHDREKRTDSALLTCEEARDYTHLLNECIKQDQLVDEQRLTVIQRRLDARNALGQSASDAKVPTLEIGKFEPKKLLHLRPAPRVMSLRPKLRKDTIIPVTVGLSQCKLFKTPIENSFSVGKHPTAISLNDRYLETFFCRRTPGNSLILLSTTAIDIANRGSGVELSVRLSKILGTEKDKILAGAWCEHSQRLLLVGNHRMYFYDFQGREHARKFRCQPVHGDPCNTPRFISCTYSGSIFYAFKSDADSYTLEKHAYPISVSKKMDPSESEDRTFFLQPQTTMKIDGNLAALCTTHNRIVFVYRRFQFDGEHQHFIGLYDHEFNNVNRNNTELPPNVKWVTAITSFGNDDQFLLCDPRGQQLLLYRSTDGILIRRFRIGAINACCLADGKLVLWLQKQYASTPVGKLHFITAPHLEDRAYVSKSLPLLIKA